MRSNVQTTMPNQTNQMVHKSTDNILTDPTRDLTTDEIMQTGQGQFQTQDIMQNIIIDKKEKST